MWQDIATWQETLKARPDLSTKTVTLYTQDARRFAIWVQHEHPGLKVTQITPTDAKAYRDSFLAKCYAPTTINRALISLMLFFDTIKATNPFLHLTMIEVIEPAPVALSKAEWNAVRRSAEAAARSDHALALALATLFRYAGTRVSEVAALQIPDMQVSARPIHHSTWQRTQVSRGPSGPGSSRAAAASSYSTIAWSRRYCNDDDLHAGFC